MESVEAGLGPQGIGALSKPEILAPSAEAQVQGNRAEVSEL